MPDRLGARRAHDRTVVALLASTLLLACSRSAPAVEETNQPPAVGVSCGSAPEDAAATCTLAPADPDVPVQALSCALDPATTCAGAALTGCASVTVPPQGEAAGPGSCVVAVAITDSDGASSIGSGTLSIEEANLDPSIAVSCSAIGEDAEATCAITVEDADAPSQELTCLLDLATTCAGAVLTGCTGVTVPPQHELAGPGSCVVAVWASDGNGGTGAGWSALTIGETNEAPAVAVSCGSAPEDGTATCTLAPADPDLPVQALSCALDPATTCAGAALTGCASVTVPPQGEAAGPGSCLVAVAIADSDGASSVGSGTLSIEEANLDPSIAVSCSAIGEDAEATCAIGVEDADVPAQELTCLLDATTTCAGAVVTDCTSVTIPPQGELPEPGACVVGVVVLDGNGGTGAGSSTLAIDKTNEPPAFASATGTVQGHLGEPVSAPAGDAIDPDYPLQSVTCSAGASTCSFPVAVGGSGVATAACAVSFTAEAKETCSIEIVATDEGGATATRLLTIEAVQDCAWTGLASGAWDDAGSWSCAVVPDVGDTARIAPGAPLYPSIASSVTIGSLELDGTLVVTDVGALQVTTQSTMKGSITNAGTLALPALNASTLTGGTLTNTGTLVVAEGAVVIASGVTLVEGGDLHAAGLGADTVASFTILSGGVVTHPRGLLDGLAFAVTGLLDVQAGGSIDVSSKGYRGAGRDGLGGYYAETRGEDGVATTSGGAYGAAGGSYGGSGIVAYGSTNATYGDAFAPAELGSGGGRTSSGPGGNGGGRIALVVGSLDVAGKVLANGGGGNDWGSGGSGGAVAIAVQGGSFSGSGTLRAAGGGASWGGAGGGGRIAVTGFASRTFSGAVDAATVFTAREGRTGDLQLAAGVLEVAADSVLDLDALDSFSMSGASVVTNAGTLTLDVSALTGGTVSNLGTLLVASGDLAVGSGVTLEEGGTILAPGLAPDTLSSLTVVPGGVLSHPRGVLGGLALTITGRLHVRAGGRIDVSSKGYRGANREGNAGERGETRGENGVATTSGGAYRSAGGSYGGSGKVAYSGSTNATYGDAFAPAELGSGGGGQDGGAGGNGGGRVALSVGELRSDGQILADGESVEEDWAGGGSGGAIAIRVQGGSFAGSGTIRAGGGAAGSYGGAGGGGRIAITGYASRSYFGSIVAASVYVAAAGSDRHLVISGGTVDIAAGEDLELDSFSMNGGSVRNAGTFRLVLADIAAGTVVNTGTLLLESEHLAIPAGVVLEDGGILQAPGLPADTVTSLTVLSGGVLSHPAGVRGGLALTVTGLLDVRAGGRVDVSSKGYRGANRDGNAGVLGETRGADGEATTSGGASGSAGGSYGGRGGTGSWGGSTNVVYGDAFAPADLGSGGGAGYDEVVGGNGGGRAALSAGDLLVNGELLADGGGGDWAAGGGSGGTIAVALRGGTFAGSGTLRAVGGAGGSYGGSGGGGRIAITGFASNAFGGAAAGGTIYMAAAGASGSVVLGNGTLEVAAGQVLALDALSMNGGSLSNAGTLELDALSMNGGSIVNTGTLALPDLHSSVIAGTVVNRGTLLFASGDLVIPSGVLLEEGGILQAPGLPADTVSSLTVLSGGVLSHPRGLQDGLALTVAGLLDVRAGGRIDVSSRGYRGALNGGLAGDRGETRGEGGVATTSGGAYGGAGASYGGAGGSGSLYGSTTNAVYGDPATPADLGSGGGARGWGAAGDGGGRITLSAADILVDGEILANGGGGTDIYCGGGSGGGIAISLQGGSLAGAGAIRAAGGAAARYGGAGGGGRIAITGSGTDAFAGTVSAPGNQPGTVHRPLAP
jgi:hypothetical protein